MVMSSSPRTSIFQAVQSLICAFLIALYVQLPPQPPSGQEASFHRLRTYSSAHRKHESGIAAYSQAEYVRRRDYGIGRCALSLMTVCNVANQPAKSLISLTGAPYGTLTRPPVR